ncbi:MAG: type II toxin-antitoxin system PemK/MazF family toxin [Leifsonia sp.]
MRRGDVVLAQFDPALGGEATKARPCIIVSNAGANRAIDRAKRGAYVVVPLTSRVDYLHPGSHVLIDDADAIEGMGLRTVSKVQTEQIRAISVERVYETLGRTPSWIMYQVDDAMRFHLSL